MNLGEIRAMARSITDLDVSDVSDTILNGYILDGYNRFMALERRWPWLEGDFALSTVAATQATVLTDVGDIREITAIIHDDGTSGRLTWIGHGTAEEEFYGASNGVPCYWSKWSSSIYLWPIPDAEYTLSVRGYRNPVDWTASDIIEVDADSTFHIALVYYAVSLMYQLQEDAELAAIYRRSFDEAVGLARAEAMRLPQAQALVLHGGRRSRWVRRRLIGP